MPEPKSPVFPTAIEGILAGAEMPRQNEMEVILQAGRTGVFLLERGQKGKGEQNFSGTVNTSGSSSTVQMKEKEKSERDPTLTSFTALTFQTSQIYDQKI